MGLSDSRGKLESDPAIGPAHPAKLPKVIRRMFPRNMLQDDVRKNQVEAVVLKDPQVRC